MAKTTKKPIATSKPLKTTKIVKKESIKEVEEPKKTIVKKVKELPVVKSKQSVLKKASATLNVDSLDEKAELSIEKKLITLYKLQQIDSQIDKIRIIRGELPLEVQDLEDEIAGLETRVDNYIQETVVLEKFVLEKKNAIKDSQLLIKKYEDQQMNVRNNREYDSLTKEIEFQNLEIQLSEKRIREYQQSLDAKKLEIERFQEILQDRKNDLEIKNSELEDIVAETEKEENELIRS